MKLIVGLGNPGTKYALNRHNTGFMVVDYLKQHLTKETRYLKPDTFMNKSGDAVVRELHFYKLPIQDLIVIHDDLDLRLGEFKIQLGRGPRVHNGVNHIEERLGNKLFYRVRVGVDNREPANRTPGDAYVLQNFSPEELAILESTFAELKTRVAQLC